MSDPVKHHFVPIFYLSKWADQDGYVLSTRRASDGELVTHPVKPKETAFEKNLYSLEKSAPEHRQIIEKSFFAAEVDDKAAPLHEKLLHGHVHEFSHDDRAYWARFLLAQRLRVPEIVKDLRVDAAAKLRASLDANPEEFLKISGKTNYKFSEWVDARYVGLIDDFGVTMLPKLFSSPKIIHDICALHWWTTDVTTANVTLLTSDRPFWMSTGLADPNCLLALPISPTRIFFASRSADWPDRILRNGPNKLVRRCNESIASQCARFVYGKADKAFLRRVMIPRS